MFRRGGPSLNRSFAMRRPGFNRRNGMFGGVGLVVILFIILLSLGLSGKLGFTEVRDDNVYIFFAPWCGHCKRSMPEFESAVAQGQGKVVLVDSDLPESQPLIELYGVKGYPTIMRGDKVFEGARTADEILAFAN